MAEKSSGWVLLASEDDIQKVEEVIRQLFPKIEIKDASNNGHHCLTVSGEGAEMFFALVQPIKQVI